jgi:hypothetical protein
MESRAASWLRLPAFAPDDEEPGMELDTTGG